MGRLTQSGLCLEFSEHWEREVTNQSSHSRCLKEESLMWQSTYSGDPWSLLSHGQVRNRDAAAGVDWRGVKGRHC